MNNKIIKMVMAVWLVVFAITMGGDTAYADTDRQNTESVFTEKAETDSLAERIKQGAINMLQAIKKMMPQADYEKAEKIFSDYQGKVDEATPDDADQQERK